MKHVSFRGRLVMLGCGSIGQGVLPLILRHIDMPKDRITIVTADARGRDVAAECGVRFVEQPATRDNFRDLLVPLLGRGRLPAESLGRCLLRGADRALPGDRRALPRHLHRALARRLHRPVAHALPTLQLRAAGKRARCRPPVPGRPHGGADPRRQPRPGLPSDEGGAAPHRPRHRTWRCRAVRPGRLGGACREAGRQGRPHRRARHPGRAAPPQGGRRVRQHLVHRRLRGRGPPAGRARLGHAREGVPRRWPPPRIRLRCRHLPAPPRRRHPRAELDAAGRPDARLPRDAQRVDLDRRLLHGSRRERRRALPADRPLRLPPLRRRRALRP